MTPEQAQSLADRVLIAMTGEAGQRVPDGVRAADRLRVQSDLAGLRLCLTKTGRIRGMDTHFAHIFIENLRRTAALYGITEATS